MGNTCFFTGHRDPPDWVRDKLAEVVAYHISNYGVTDFLVGNHGGFDRIAARAVADAKAKYPHISLYLMLAYFPKPGQKPDLGKYDGFLYPEGMETVPGKFAILRLNQITVTMADYLIAYVDHDWGGAAKAFEYARRREQKGKIKITNLGALK